MQANFIIGIIGYDSWICVIYMENFDVDNVK